MFLNLAASVLENHRIQIHLDSRPKQCSWFDFLQVNWQRGGPNSCETDGQFRKKSRILKTDLKSDEPHRLAD